MIIIHGENLVQSRQKLVSLMESAKSAGHQINRLEASGLTIAKLEEQWGSSDLFGEPKTIILEGLHSLIKSKKKDELLQWVATACQSPQDNLEIVIWESRALTKTMLGRFPEPQVFEFKVSNQVFKWLDSLAPGPKGRAHQLTLFHQAVASEDAYMCFAMLIRQIRLLLQVKDGGQPKGPPFMIAKFKKQADPFSLDKLLWAYRQLLEIDHRQKTSQGYLSLQEELDLFLAQL